MSTRLIVLLALAGGATLIVLAYRWYRSRPTPLPDRLDVDDLGLELMTGCCAFVVFVTPSCTPCKAALRVVDAVAHEATGATEVATVDAVERPDIAIRYAVRTIPTVFLITASGHVIRRWLTVPEPADARGALANLR